MVPKKLDKSKNYLKNRFGSWVEIEDLKLCEWIIDFFNNIFKSFEFHHKSCAQTVLRFDLINLPVCCEKALSMALSSKFLTSKFNLSSNCLDDFICLSFKYFLMAIAFTNSNFAILTKYPPQTLLLFN